ncbi:MAG: Short chain dehydrogenase [Promethearchaeota archaeon]|nr:MAG: Short chain dehydrogenase [Candidatus Lokiarchaeota archaeon]
MKKEIIKRIIVLIIAVAVSAYIWHVNRNIFHNIFRRALILSITTFIIVYIPFELYFSIKTIWYNRWSKIELDKIHVEKIHISIEQNKKHGYLVANILRSKGEEKQRNKNTLILISHGYSDVKESLQYLYYPLVLQGYVVLSYDARGSGESEKLGNKNEFLARLEDYQKIIKWVKNHNEYQNLNIYTIGFSIGALIAVCAAFNDERIKKIIAISLISKYRENVLHQNPIVLLSYFFKGIKLFPSQEENERLSPYLIFKKHKQNSSNESWKDVAHKMYLVHSKNDNVIKYKNFQENQSILKLPSQNLLIFEKGGHTLKKNEVALVGGILEFLKR